MKPARLSAIRTGRRVASAFAFAAVAALLGGCASSGAADRPPLELAPRVDIPRFMGDWYVIASIPTRFEKGAHNARERYALNADGTIAINFTFRADAFDGAPKSIDSKGFVQAENGAIWGVQFVWPVKVDYRISFVAADYSATVITRKKRDHLWIMARTPTLPEAELQRLIAFAARQGYDPAKIQRVPQR